MDSLQGLSRPCRSSLQVGDKDMNGDLSLFTKEGFAKPKEFRGVSDDAIASIMEWRNKDENDRKDKTTTVLDRQYAQLRQKDNEAASGEKDLKKFLKSHGILFGDSLEGTKIYFADEWDKIMEDYEKWRAAMENCYIVLKSKNGGETSRQQLDQLYRISEGKKGIVAQAQTRFSPKKKKITRWRMEQFSNNMRRGGFREGLEVTLTTDPKKFTNLKEVGNEWKFYIEKFMDFARTRLNRAGKKGHYCYLRACELTESGLLHVHIGFFGVGIARKIIKKHTDGKIVEDFIFPKDDIKELWTKYGIGEITWIGAKPINDLTDYVTKHISKSWGGESNEMLEAFLHYTGMRQWTSSVGAVPKAPPSVERWELVAVAFTPAEGLMFRDDLISEGYKLIQDDLSDIKNAS